MSIVSDPKLNQLIRTWPANTVSTSAALKERGYSPQLLAKYLNSGWLESVGKGAYKIAGQDLSWQGAVRALQAECGSTLRPGGLSALELAGFSHYARSDQRPIHLFGATVRSLPRWFRDMAQTNNWQIHGTAFLAAAQKLPLRIHEYHSFSVQCSAPETALLELMFMVPHEISFTEAFEICAGLSALRSVELKNLLEVSTNIKVNRLVLFAGYYHGHDWFKKLEFSRIKIGSGKRVVEPGGILDHEFLITVPRTLESVLEQGL